MNLKKYYMTLLSASSELETLIGKNKIVSAYPQEVKNFPLVIFEDMNSSDVAFSDNLPEGTSAQVRIHIFSKTIKGYPKAEAIADVGKAGETGTSRFKKVCNYGKCGS